MNLEALRQQIHAVEWQERGPAKAFAFGLPSIDEALHGGLAAGALHEWIGSNRGTALGICAVMLARIAQTQGPILWCAKNIDLYPPGLQTFGLLPEHLIFVQVHDDKEALWVLEEGLNSPKLGAVVGEKISVNLTSSRRLQLSASKSGVTAFLLHDAKDKLSTTSNAVTRWRISPLPSPEAPGLFSDNGVGSPRFEVELLRCRGGNAPLKWSLEWNESSLCFNLFSAFERPREIADTVPARQTLHALNRAG